MLGWITLLEPRVERPMHEDKIRHSRPAALEVHCSTRILPDAVDDHSVVVGRMPLKPSPKATGESELAEPRTKGPWMPGQIRKPRRRRRVRTYDIDPVAQIAEAAAELIQDERRPSE